MSSLTNRVAAAVIVAVVGLGAITPTLAGEAEVKQRQNAMKALSAHAGSIGAVIKGEVDDQAGAMHHAVALHATAQAAGTAFGPDSEGGKALPAIWEKPDDFKAAYMALVDASAKAAEAAEANDMEALKTAFGAVGKSCGGCHGSFREKN